MAHTFKSSFGQCKCLWCGSRSVECPATPEIRAAVAAFAQKHGRTWKAALRTLWTSGKDEGLLRQARNTVGPSGLDTINPRMIARYLPAA